MIKEELKKEAKSYAKKKFDEEEQAYLHDIIAQTYLAGAEPREKRIKELEQKLEQTEKDIADYQFNYPKIKELEKENEELKRRLDNLFNSDCWASEQLTKAKDHIKQLLDCLKQDTNDPQTNYYVCQYMDKAEQFLKEIEK